MTAPPATSTTTPVIQAASVRGEERGGGGDVLRRAEAPERVGVGEGGAQPGGDLLQVPFGEDGLRRDAVDPDPERARLRRGVLGEQDDPGLGRGVGDGGAGVRPAPRGGADRDDRAAAALLHPGQEAFQGQERGEQVAVDGGAPAGFRDLLERRGRGEAAARVGHQDVHRAEARLDGLPQRLDLAEVGNVAGHRHRLAAVAGDGVRDGGRGGRVAAVHGDGGAAPRELAGDGRPDAPRAAGDQRHLPVERAHDGSPAAVVRISIRCPSGSRK